MIAKEREEVQAKLMDELERQLFLRDPDTRYEVDLELVDSR